jgi:aminoglycoside 6'-N-acetyltransferase I
MASMTRKIASITNEAAGTPVETVIREAQASDDETWAKLRAELWPDCPVERHRLEIAQLTRSAGVVALAVGAGEAVGFAEVSIRVDHVDGTSSTPVPYLEGWYVAAAHRGRGIGTALLEFIEAWALKRGYREIASDAEIANEASILLHGRRGFVEVGRTVHFVKTL